jgi:acyl carrier protein
MDRRTKITDILRAVSKKDITLDAADSLFDSGLLDSFALPDLVSALEQEFSVTIPDSDLTPRKFESIERIEQYLDSLA